MAQFFNHLFIEVATSGIAEPELLKLMSNRDDDTQSATKTGKDFKGAVDVSTLFKNCHNLLMVLFERDIRHSFVKEGFWLSSTHKVSQFMADLRKDKFVPKFLLKYVPHIIPHKEVGPSLAGFRCWISPVSFRGLSCSTRRSRPIRHHWDWFSGTGIMTIVPLGQ